MSQPSRVSSRWFFNPRLLVALAIAALAVWAALVADGAYRRAHRHDNRPRGHVPPGAAAAKEAIGP